MTAPASLDRRGIGHESVTRLEYTPNQRQAAHAPLVLHGGMSIEVVPDIIPSLLSDYFVVAAEQSPQPTIYGEPAFRVPYPTLAGRYLRVGALSVLPNSMGELRPALMMVLDLTGSLLPQIRRPSPTVCRVGLIGNLFLPPIYDLRGPVHNFGLPRALRVYATNWPKPFTLENPPPHPRGWKLLYENTDLRARWGWTYCDFEPTRTTHLLFFFSHFPTLPRNFDSDAAKYAELSGVPWHFRGLTIERLAVHAYESAVDFDDAAPYVPITSWNNQYEAQPSPFTSRFWSVRGVVPVSPPLHQSIYREPGQSYHGQQIGFDLQPSALVGLPLQVRLFGSGTDAEVTPDGYGYRSYYSGDVIHADAAITTNLVIETTDTQSPSLRGLRLRVPLRVRPEQTFTVRPEARCYVYGTDDASIVFSSNTGISGWNLITAPPFDFSAEDADSLMNFIYGQEILFAHDERYRFYRLEFRIPPGGTMTGPKRFELAELTLLRSPHPTIVPRHNEVVRVDEILVRLTGPNLVDDYEFVNGRDIMDVRIQRSTRDRPFEDVVRLRSLLDIREKTGAQVVACQRATRARVQYFRDEQYSTAQRTITILLQQLLRGGTTEGNALRNHQLVNVLPDGSGAPVGPNLQGYSRATIDNLLANISGVVTDRNLNFGSVLGLVSLLETSGVPAQDILNMMSVFANSSFDDLAGVAGNLIAGAISAGLAPLEEILNTLLGIFGFGDDPPTKSVLFNFGQLSNGPVPLIAAFNGLATTATTQDLRNLSYRPALSYSGSIGAQFIAGGSLGVSAQLDGGKSRSLSWGTQGQANDALVVTGPSWRRSRREEEIENAQLFDWKGADVKRAGAGTDIAMIRIPIGITLSPRAEPGEIPDAFRLRIDLIPPDLQIEVRFIGQRAPLDTPQP